MYRQSSISSFQKSIPEIFCSSKLSIIPTSTSTKSINNANLNAYEIPSSAITVQLEPTASSSSSSKASTTATTTAYYRDTNSKTAKVVIPILLEFENEYDRRALLRSGAVQPPPTDKTRTNKTESDDDNDNDDSNSNSIKDPNQQSDALDLNSMKPKPKMMDSIDDLWSCELETLGETRGDSYDDDWSEKFEVQFQCLCYAHDSQSHHEQQQQQQRTSTPTTKKEKDLIVEGIQIMSTALVDTAEGFGVRFDVEIAVRSLKQQKQQDDTTNSNNNNIMNGNQNNENLISRAKLEIFSVLICTDTQSSVDHHQQQNKNKRNKFASSSSTSNRSMGMGMMQQYAMHDSVNNIEGSSEKEYLAAQSIEMGLSAISPYENNNNYPSQSYFARTLTYTLPAVGAASSTSTTATSSSSLGRQQKQQQQHGLCLNLTLVPALTIQVREVSGTSSHKGVTLVSLVIYHSDLHNEDVTITNIALHPGHSRLSMNNHNNNNNMMMMTTMNAENHTHEMSLSMPGGEHSVINMTKNVRWGYAQGMAPSLPILLKPKEAIATVIQINATENIDARAFVSPICVRGVVGQGFEERNYTSNSGSGSAVSSYNRKDQIILNQKGVVGKGDDDIITDTYRDDDGLNTSVITVAADAKWTTTRCAKGTTDAFRVSLSVQEAECTVGAQVVVSLKVMNLNDDARDLMLLMAKDDTSSHNEELNNNHIRYDGGYAKNDTGSVGMEGVSTINSSTNKLPSGVNNAIVYEVNGYIFGVLGISGDDDGTVRYNKDHELLAVDAALLLGEVKAQHSIDAELRFVPLREGILDVPNLKLYDRYSGNWYDCVHTLKIISVPSQ